LRSGYRSPAVVVIGILGLGEAGGTIAADVRSAGATVRGYDPLAATRPDVGTPVGAAEGADLVLSLTTAAQARTAATSVHDALGPGQVYADANTSGGALKRELAALVEPTGARFADVAAAGEGLLERMEEGSRRHTARRAHEMADVSALLLELGVTPQVSDAARAQLRELRSDG
jgi:hypothetical protein